MDCSFSKIYLSLKHDLPLKSKKKSGGKVYFESSFVKQMFYIAMWEKLTLKYISNYILYAFSNYLDQILKYHKLVGTDRFCSVTSSHILLIDSIY